MSKHVASLVLLAVLAIGAVWLTSAPARADFVDIHYTVLATGVDSGPQDGVFDSFTIPFLGAVNNNGFSSFRTAFEFNVAELPTASGTFTAKLTLELDNPEGFRMLQLHGYQGDGLAQLSDFSSNMLLGTASVTTVGTTNLVFDVTNFVIDVRTHSTTYAGFNIREEPPHAPAYPLATVIGMPDSPVLSIEFAPPPATLCDGIPATIVGTPGDDIINGTAGNDVIAALSGNDQVHGLDGNDVICGDDGKDRVFGDAGTDTLHGEAGNDTLDGGDDRDFLFGGTGNDRLKGGGASDTVSGEAGNDTLIGGSGADSLIGGTGNDALSGGVGDDAMTCGAGTDTAAGETGTDTADASCETVTGVP